MIINRIKIFVYLLLFNTTLQSEPDVSKTINWNQASKVTQFGDHPVFRVYFPDGSLVVKLQSAASSVKEVFAGRVAQHTLTRADVPSMKIVSDAKEKDDFYNMMVRLKITVKSNKEDVLVMNFMQGKELGEADNLLKPTTDQAVLNRLKSIGQLYAYNFLIQGADRFLLKFHGKNDHAYNGLARNDNIFLAESGTNVQAIDNTIRDGLKYELSKSVANAALNQIKRIEPLIDELIYSKNDDICEITTFLEQQISMGDLAKIGRGALREGFVEAMRSIGKSNVNFSSLLAGVATSDFIKKSDLLSAKDTSGKNYSDFLKIMRVFFDNKFDLFNQITKAMGEKRSGDLIKIAHITLKTELGKSLSKDEKSFIESYDRNPAKSFGGTAGKEKRKNDLWPASLLKIETDKNKIVKKRSLTPEEKNKILRNVLHTAQVILLKKDPALEEDFCRMSAKIILLIR